MGTNQVSVRTKMVNATWIAARPQWYCWSIGLTNSVQPYCRLAIITMQMMPKISCPQRVPSDAWTRVSVVLATVAIIHPRRAFSRYLDILSKHGPDFSPSGLAYLIPYTKGDACQQASLS